MIPCHSLIYQFQDDKSWRSGTDMVLASGSIMVPATTFGVAFLLCTETCSLHDRCDCNGDCNVGIAGFKQKILG